MSRVRTEARTSPVAQIPPTAVTTVLVTVAAVGVHASPMALAGVVLAAQLLVATGPTYGRSGVSAAKLVPVAVAACVATGLTLWPERLGRSGTAAASALDIGGSMAATGIALGVLVPAAFAAQLRRAGPGAVARLSDSVVTGVLALLATGWVSAGVTAGGRAHVITAAVIVVGALLVGRVGSVAAVWAVTACALGGVLLAATSSGSSLLGAAGGASLAATALLGVAVGRRWSPLPPQRWAVAAVAPFALTGPVVFVAGLLGAFG